MSSKKYVKKSVTVKSKKASIPVEEEFDFKIEYPETPIVIGEDKEIVEPISNKPQTVKPPVVPPIQKRRIPRVNTRIISKTKKFF